MHLHSRLTLMIDFPLLQMMTDVSNKPPYSLAQDRLMMNIH